MSDTKITRTATAGWLHAHKNNPFLEYTPASDLFSDMLEPGDTFWLIEREMRAVGGIDGPDPRLAQAVLVSDDDGVLLRVEPTGDHEQHGDGRTLPEIEYRVIAVHAPEEARAPSQVI